MTRLPPHDLPAEQAILGAILLEGRAALDRVALWPLVVTDFYVEAHRATFAAMRRLHDADHAVDVLTVSAELRRAGDLDAVGGPAALAGLVEAGSIASYLDSYLGLVVNAGKLRELIQQMTRLVADAYDAHDGADELIGRGLASLERLARRRTGEAFDAAVAWRDVVESWQRGTVRSGLRDLDTLTGGITRGQLLVVGGFTSIGKTAYSWDRAIEFARAGRTVEVLSLEESSEAATRRAVSNISGVSLYKLRTGQLHQVEFERSEDAVRELQDLPITVTTVETLRTSDERAVIGAVSKSRADVVMLDHIQKVEIRKQDKDELRTYGIGRVMDRLAHIALRDGKVLWVNAQLARDREAQRKVRPPVLGDLRDSAFLEQTARQVWLLCWAWKLDTEHDREAYEVHVAKHSEGGTGRVKLRFHADCGRFEDWDVSG